MEPDDFSQDTSGTYSSTEGSNSNSMGIDSGSYDPSQDNDLSSRLPGSSQFIQDIQNINAAGGGDTYDARQALQTARGITSTNPYGYNNPFQGIADFFGVDVSSGVEASKGKKDKLKMIEFVKASHEIKK